MRSQCRYEKTQTQGGVQPAVLARQRAVAKAAERIPEAYQDAAASLGDNSRRAGFEATFQDVCAPCQPDDFVVALYDHHQRVQRSASASAAWSRSACMNSFERSLVTKAGYDNGWEVSTESSAVGTVSLCSALHRCNAVVSSAFEGNDWIVAFPPGRMVSELERSGGLRSLGHGRFVVSGDAELATLLSHASRLARTLPDLPCRRYEEAVAEQLATVQGPSSATEVERLVRQRVGQDVFRESLMDYWGGACAVLGLTESALLRASHAKPWAECASDEERLNVFNGFLLAAHLDAVFDRHLMTFDQAGVAVFAQSITHETRACLGLAGAVRLRWISPEHEPFLRVHRSRFEQMRAI